MSRRAIYFGAGPAKIPEQVLQKVKDDLLSYKESGVSILEMSHRSADFLSIVRGAERKLRNVLDVPNNYKVLFLQGGGCGQFSAVPLNLTSSSVADYVVTGTWSSKAASEARKYKTVNLVLPQRTKYTDIPDFSTWKLSADASYVFYCDNETIHGVEFDFVPSTGNIPLVCDMSSNLLSRPVNISQYGLIFACAQKNLGCAGATVVIVRDDLVGLASPQCPSIWDFKVQLTNESLYNTPSTLSIYVLDLMLDWVKEQGGLHEMHRRSVAKSDLIYDVIDSSNGFYSCPVDKSVRSRMNIPFRVGCNGGDEELEKVFMAGAKRSNLTELGGHRSVGGLRASLYNSMSEKETQVLVNYMQEFRKGNS